MALLIYLIWSLIPAPTLSPKWSSLAASTFESSFFLYSKVHTLSCSLCTSQHRNFSAHFSTSSADPWINRRHFYTNYYYFKPKATWILVLMISSFKDTIKVSIDDFICCSTLVKSWANFYILGHSCCSEYCFSSSRSTEHETVWWAVLCPAASNLQLISVHPREACRF